MPDQPPKSPRVADTAAAAAAVPAAGEQHELASVDTKPVLPIENDLMGLARLGELRAIQKLFDSGKYNANSADEQGITPLHVCSPSADLYT